MRQMRPRVWRSQAEWHEVCFTIDQARRALPYAQRVLHDATEAYCDVQRARQSLAAGVPSSQRAKLTHQRDHALHRLNRTIDECHALGVEHFDVSTGTIAFRAMVHGRPLCLIWRLDEPTTNAWEDVARMVPRPLTQPAAARRCRTSV